MPHFLESHLCNDMKPSRKFPTQTRLTLLGALCFVSLTATAKPPKTTAFAEIAVDYHRVMLPSGRYKPETYVVAEGQKLDLDGTDESLHVLDFSGVAHIISNALYEADYVPTPTQNPEQTDLLIVIHWGKTTPLVNSGMFASSSGYTLVGGGTIHAAHLDWYKDMPPPASDPMPFSQVKPDMDSFHAGQSFLQNIRHQQNAYHARLLGYANDLNRCRLLGQTVLSMKHQETDLRSQLESPRYFVILQAYDFQKMKQEKKQKMLWSTRFSIQAKDRQFDESLLPMAMAASRVIGKHTDYLKTHLIPARVEFGELEYMGMEQE